MMSNLKLKSFVDHRQTTLTNNMKSTTSRVKTLMDGCFLTEMRLFFRLKWRCNFFFSVFVVEYN